jgi:hypothetical protein
VITVSLIKFLRLEQNDTLIKVTHPMGINVEDIGVHEELIGVWIIDFVRALIYRQRNQNVIDDMKNLGFEGKGRKTFYQLLRNSLMDDASIFCSYFYFLIHYTFICFRSH